MLFRSPTGLNHVEAATHDGKLYLAGGYLDGENPTDNFWQYDPATDEWAKLAPLPRATAAGSSVVIGDKLYVAGGAPQTFGASAPVAPFPDLQIYDFATGECSTRVSARVARSKRRSPASPTLRTVPRVPFIPAPAGRSRTTSSGPASKRANRTAGASIPRERRP